MYAGASECSAAIVLIDVQKPIESQTQKHLQILEALSIKQVIFALNKMDAVDFKEQVFLQRKQEVEACLQHREHRHIWIPLSALTGDNVVHRSTKTPWYDGMSLLEALETIPNSQQLSESEALIEVQGVQGRVVYARVLQGLLSSGALLSRGDESLSLNQLLVNGKPATKPMGDGQLSFMLNGNAKVERGQYWGTTPIHAAHTLELHLCWMANEPSGKEIQVLMQRGTSLTAVNVSLDKELEPNELRTIQLRLPKAIDMGPGQACENENIILIDPQTKYTLAAGRIEKWTT
jgi:sulfate adenylyltransferase subunit 1